MTYKEVYVEEYDLEICENCNHPADQHYKKPVRVERNDGTFYIASGCMVVAGDRKLEGENPYLRCNCMECV